MSSGPDFLSIAITREALAEEKQRTRIRAREALGALSLPERARRSSIICGNIGNHPLYLEAKRIFLYRALPDEPDLRKLEEDPRPLFFPVIQDRGQSSSMRFFPGGDDAFRPGAFGIEEPATSSTPQIPTAADVMLVPGRAFTTGGLRIGRGGGFYDRYLSGLNPADFPILIGVGFQEQLFPSLPAGARDFPMHLVITDRIDNRRMEEQAGETALAAKPVKKTATGGC